MFYNDNATIPMIKGLAIILLANTQMKGLAICCRHTDGKLCLDKAIAAGQHSVESLVTQADGLGLKLVSLRAQTKFTFQLSKQSTSSWRLLACP
jgi:hypothetical protein